ncbi:SMI1/KNR4 family protein [Tenacibaculum sp. ZH5_bin.1]|uniref:SMI1/KNR4 family protein n=1 Tax=Tenacibaculum TaxID=104267 RepID=UPI00142FB852|nr:SMI1/KNR4 family protein [Tenacibaculum mesophilum]KAF9660122.1 hypothetical protein HBA12_07770 [Tenacibaculum mesophilum]
MISYLNKDYATFLKFRKESLSLDLLEQEFNLRLPPIFRAFVQNFEGIIGDVYLDENNELQTLTYYKYEAHEIKNMDLMFTDFLDIEQVFESYNNNDIWFDNGVVPITEHDHGGTILLGIREENQDKLYFEYSNGLEYIENNIFSFLKNLKFVFDYDEVKENIYI